MSAAPTIEAHAADLGGCGHYRIIWPAETLYNAGAAVDLVTPSDSRSMFEVRPDLDATFAAGRTVLGRLARIPDADVIVLQRPLTAQLLHVIRQLKAAGKAIVVEVDDDFQTIHPDNIAWRTVHPTMSPERNYQHLAEACRLADMVTVTTPALAARYGRHGRVRVIPNYVPAHYLHVLRDDHDPLRLGWSGNVDTHPHDLQVTRGAVARVLRRHDLKFHLIGPGKVTARDEHGRELEDPDDPGKPALVTDLRIPRNLGLSPDTQFAHTGGWLHLEKYPRALAELDIGIVPLDDTAFNQAKSWLKGLEYAATGVPFVASPTGPYRELADLGVGRLATRPRDWERELDRLIVDEDYRLEAASHGRRTASKLTVEAHAGRWAEAWAAAANNSVRNRTHLTTTPKGTTP